MATKPKTTPKKASKPKVGKNLAPPVPKEPKPDGPISKLKRYAVEVIVGYHPILCNRHILTRFDNNTIRIKRDDYISYNPRTGAEERKSFELVYQDFSESQYLWEIIQNNPYSPYAVYLCQFATWTGFVLLATDPSC